MQVHTHGSTCLFKPSASQQAAMQVRAAIQMQGDSGQWTVDSGQCNSGQWTVDSGQWAVDRSKLFQINRVICQKPFQALASSDSLALPVPRTGLVEKSYCRASDIYVELKFTCLLLYSYC